MLAVNSLMCRDGLANLIALIELIWMISGVDF